MHWAGLDWIEGRDFVMVARIGGGVRLLMRLSIKLLSRLLIKLLDCGFLEVIFCLGGWVKRVRVSGNDG